MRQFGHRFGFRGRPRRSTAPPAFTNTLAPAITGTAMEGQTLTVSNGSWTPTPAGYTRQWYRNGSPIAGATGSTYVLVDADGGQTIFAIVTANDGGSGTTSAQSNTVGPIAQAEPQNTALPSISGTPAEGQTLTASNGTWTNSPTGFAYQWRRGVLNIVGATASTYTLTALDENEMISVVVTASNVHGAGPPATSAPVGPVDTSDPLNTVQPAISGTPTEGETLTVSNGSWANSPVSYAYQWNRGLSQIAGATSNTYVLVTADVGQMITCTVTATNAFGSTPSSAIAVGPIAPAPVGNFLELYGGGNLDLYGGGSLELYEDVVAPPSAGRLLDLQGNLVTDLQGNYILPPA